jgi:hypothetical protein
VTLRGQYGTLYREHWSGPLPYTVLHAVADPWYAFICFQVARISCLHKSEGETDSSKVCARKHPPRDTTILIPRYNHSDFATQRLNATPPRSKHHDDNREHVDPLTIQDAACRQQNRAAFHTRAIVSCHHSLPISEALTSPSNNSTGSYQQLARRLRNLSRTARFRRCRKELNVRNANDCAAGREVSASFGAAATEVEGAVGGYGE